MDDFSVLIIDDSSEMRDFLKGGLYDSSSNIEIHEAANTENAHERINELFYDLVICRCGTCDIDSNDLMKFIRTHPTKNDTPVILIGSRENRSSIRKGLRYGALGYLIEPISIERLIRKILVVTDRFNRRIHERVDAGNHIVLHYNSRSATGELIDISLGGLSGLIECDNEYPGILGEVSVDVETEDSGECISLDGVIYRLEVSRRFNKSNYLKLSVKFDEIDFENEEELTELMSFLKSQRLDI